MGTRIERTPETQTSEDFEVILRSGELIDLVVEQRGSDVALRLTDPQGGLLLRIDSPTGRLGPEQLLFVAEHGGVHRATVEVGGVDPDGSYELTVVALRDAQPREREEAQTLRIYAQAEQLRRTGGPESLRAAATLYPQAIERWERAGKRAAQATALLQWARVLALLGDTTRRAAVLEKAVAILRSGRDHQRQALAWADLGQARYDSGDSSAALAACNRALELSRSLRDSKLEARVLNQIGQLFRESGQLVTAEWAYESAAALYERSGAGLQAGLVRANLASLYEETHELDLAERALSHAQETLRDGTDLDRAYLALQRGTLARLIGRLGEARQQLELSAALYQMVGRPEFLASSWQGLTQVAVQEGRLGEAEELSRKLLTFALARSDPRPVHLARQNLGQVLFRRGKLTAARSLLQQVLVDARGVEERGTRAAALLGLARVELAEAQPEMAWALVYDALELVESQRDDAMRRELRLSLVADAQDFFDVAVEAALAMGERHAREESLARALSASERSRARVLLEALHPSSSQRGEPHLGRRAFLEDQRQALEHQREGLIESGAPTEELRAVEHGLHAALAALEALPAPDLSMLENSTPAENAGQVFENHTSEALASLPQDVVLLEYDLGEAKSVLFVVRQGRVEAFPLAPRDELEALAVKAHQILSGSAALEVGERPEQIMRQLGRALLGPIVGHLRGERLLVVPDGALWMVPFAALRVASLEGEERVLGADHDLAYAPSLASYSLLTSRRKLPLSPSPRILVFADPVFQSDDPRFLDKARPSMAEEPELFQSLRSVGGSLRRLRHSAEEAKVLEELLPASQVTTRLSFAASKAELLRQASAPFDLMHFATHGILSPKEPSLSGLVLTLVDEAGRPSDGFLRAHEIRRLNLRCPLVVLSACRTAQGKLIRGEGVLSLSQAFLEAGAGRALVTLWQVDDEATSIFMRHFYRALLLEHQTPAAALRSAQAALRAEPRWNPPFFWAGFVLQGDF